MQAPGLRRRQLTSGSGPINWLATLMGQNTVPWSKDNGRDVAVRFGW